MSYIIQATLSNPKHSENGKNEILFPLEQKDYAGEIQRLGELGIGDAVDQDCLVEDIDSYYEVLQCLKGQIVNVDELDFLAKLLDGFDTYEAQEFQAACFAYGCHDIKGLINMTYCCRETTVISDFSKLEEAGKNHYITTQGGAVLGGELDAVDGKALAKQLVQSGKGELTPYGLFFCNGMEMEELYSGHGFPPYLWDERQAELELKSPNGYVTRIFLPITELELERFQKRERMADLTGCKRSLWLFPRQGKNIALEGDMAEFNEWNELCASLNEMSPHQRQTFAAALDVTGAEDLNQIQLVASSLEDFELIPGVTDAESYGKYMIQQSGRYDFDETLDCYYNYEAFGEFLMAHEVGQFTEHGYLKCGDGSAFLDFFAQVPDTPIQEQSSADVGCDMQMGGM